jgi:uridine kinase
MATDGQSPEQAPDPATAAARRVILLAGPSGSGKSTIVRAVGLPMVYLDDFYKAGSDPTLPRHPELGIVDWDHPDSWDRQGALDAIELLCREGHAEVPVYDIAANGPNGTRTVEVGTGAFVAEGIFAPELTEDLRRRGLLLDAIVVRRDRWKNLVRRAARDLKERRKPPATILRRGMHLYRAEDEVMARAVDRGCRPLDAGRTRAALAHYRDGTTARPA